MSKKKPGLEERHLHRDEVVTIERLDEFAEDSRETQLRVLAVLRARAIDDNLYLSLAAIVIAFILPILIGLSPISPIEGSVLSRTITLLLLAGVVGGPIALAIGVPAVLDQFKKARAAVWLRSYEDELARRHAQRGRAARRWQAAH